MLEYYVNPDTQVIHMTGSFFPFSLRKGYTHCGRSQVYKLVKCNPDLQFVVPFRICKICRSRTGEK